MEKENKLKPCLITIRSLYEVLTPKSKKIADYVLSNPELILQMSIKDLADIVRVGLASVYRFCKKIGFSGYPEFKDTLRIELLTPDQKDYEVISEEDNTETVISKTFRNAIKGLNDTLTVLNNEAIRETVEVIMNSRRLDLYAAGGASGPIAHLAHYKFLNLGLICNAYTDPSVQIKAASLLTKGDCVIGLSHSGKAISVVNSLKIARDEGAVTICITNYPYSPIVEVSDIKLFTAVFRSAPLFGEAVTSRIAQLCVIETIYSCIALEKYKIRSPTVKCQ